MLRETSQMGISNEKGWVTPRDKAPVPRPEGVLIVEATSFKIFSF